MNILKGHKVETLSQLLSHYPSNINDEELNSQNLETNLLSACYEFAYSQGLSNFMVAYFTKFYHQLLQDTIVKGNRLKPVINDDHPYETIRQNGPSYFL
jgi:hypothetical protein